MEKSFETKDVMGETVTCSNGVWYGHIVPGHPIMKNNLDAVIDTIEAPEGVYVSSTNDDRKVYFKQSSLSSYNMYTKVVTKSIDGSSSEVVSAWPQKEIRGGIGDKSIQSKINYDEKNDILYYTIGDKNNSYGDEDVDNIVFMKDIETNQLTGITVLNFLKMYQQCDARIKKFFTILMLMQYIRKY